METEKVLDIFSKISNIDFKEKVKYALEQGFEGIFIKFPDELSYENFNYLFSLIDLKLEKDWKSVFNYRELDWGDNKLQIDVLPFERNIVIALRENPFADLDSTIVHCSEIIY